jgi:hypothetical protein
MYSGHSWLEIDDYVVGIIMDQFNADKTKEFIKAVNANTPYLPGALAALAEEEVWS